MNTPSLTDITRLRLPPPAPGGVPGGWLPAAAASASAASAAASASASASASAAAPGGWLPAAAASAAAPGGWLPAAAASARGAGEARQPWVLGAAGNEFSYGVGGLAGHSVRWDCGPWARPGAPWLGCRSGSDGADGWGVSSAAAAAAPLPLVLLPPQPHHMMQHGGPSIRSAVCGISSFGVGGGTVGVPYEGGGGGRHNFGHHPPRQDGVPSPFCSRGRGWAGWGGDKLPHHSVPDTQPPHTTPIPVVPSSSASDLSAVADPTLQQPPSLPVAFCDICQVDCYSLENLENHKNGKRHKKAVQRVETRKKEQKLMAQLHVKLAVKPEIVPSVGEEHQATPVDEATKVSGKRHKKAVQRLESREKEQKLMAELHVKLAVKPEIVPSMVEERQATPVDEATKVPDRAGEPDIASIAPKSILDVFVTAQLGQNKGPAASANMRTLALMVEQKMEPETQIQTVEVQSETAKVEIAAEEPAEDPSSDSTAGEAPLTFREYIPLVSGSDRCDRSDGAKGTIMRFVPGKKRPRYYDQVMESVERPKKQKRPKEQRKCCTLCNVTCDILAVFESHLSSKKHKARIQRFQGQGSVYGFISVYIPPNQRTASEGIELYGLKNREIPQE